MATDTANNRQTHLVGMEPPRIAELDEAAAAYRKVRDKRLKLQVDEAEAKEELAALMERHELELYVVPDTDYEVIVESKGTTVKVRKRADE